MKRVIYLFALFTVSLLDIVWAGSVSCNATSKCPEDQPCCSQYGECGTGSTCLGGCDIRFSYNLSACMPMPVCKDSSTNFTSLDQLVNEDNYLGNSSETDWIYTGYVDIHDNSLLVQMPNHTSGSVISSTQYVWYGKITATMKTSHLQGVVTAFILYSDVEDEIDFEFVGSQLTDAQSNYYSQGILDYQNAKNISTSDTFQNWHTYTIDWQEDHISWSVDGQNGRTLNRNDTWNDTTNRYDFPQTPSRVQFSLWPAGAASSQIGTIAWAGGAINWDSSDIKDNGYYYAYVGSVDVECYDAPSNVTKNGTSSYMYTNITADAKDIVITDKETILGSDDATGFNPDDGKQNSSKSSQSSGSQSSSKSSNADTASGSQSNMKSSPSSTGSSSGSGSGFVQSTESSTQSSTQKSNAARASHSNNEFYGGIVISLAIVFGCLTVGV